MRLHVHRFGDPAGSPVLVVHGVRNHGGRYRRLAHDALPDRRVLAVDLRGHGDSGWDPPWDVATHVADLVETLTAEGVGGPVDVVAHSFGGLLTLALAGAHPDLVRRAVLLDPAVALPVEVLRAAVRMDMRGEGRCAAWATREEARRAWVEARPPDGRWAADEDLDAFLRRGEDGRYRLHFSREAVVCAWSAMAHPPERLRWHGPVTLVTAVREPYVTDALREVLRRDLGDRLREVDVDSGHMVFWDAAEATAAIVRAALA